MRAILPKPGCRALLVGSLAALALVMSAAAAWALGELSQQPGTAGCIAQDGTEENCLTGAGLSGPGHVAVSPDGKSVYVASVNPGAVAIFDRNPQTGGLTQPGGTAGCISENGTGGACQDGRALGLAGDVAVSPDGKSVYVASPGSNGLAILNRNPQTGGLSQPQGTAGCISEDGSGGDCQDGRALFGASGVAVGPDGTSVYVASSRSNAVAIFNRDPQTGGLTQRGGTGGCISEDGTGGLCQDGKALAGALDLVISPDGGSVYATSGQSDAVVSFSRDPATGGLTQTGCISESGTGGDCQDGRALIGAAGVAASPDGNSVYVASGGSDELAIFDRDPQTGELTQPAGAAQDRTALGEAFDVTVSPDGENVYVASVASSAVAIFDRDPETAVLTQPAGAAGCISTFVTTCQMGRALGGADGIAASPDGRDVYVGSHDSNAVAILDRAAPGLPPPPPSGTPPPPSGTPPPSGGAPPPPAGAPAPTVSRFRLTPARLAGARRRGSQFHFLLSEPARVGIVIDRIRSGRSRPVGALTFPNRPAGANRIAFGGRVSGRRLARGAYRATITAIGASGARSVPRATRFAVVPTRP
jgi:DNA-binding beta-propeller fold protein YncE